jgi:leucyl-tRNA synthetase
MSETNPAAAAEVVAPHRYTAAMAADIEARWQDFWDAEGTYEAPNPSGDLAGDPELAARPKKFIMDMFRTPPVRACTSATPWATSPPMYSPGTSG